MNTEGLFEEAIEQHDGEKLESSIELVLDEWMYFFMWEKDGTDTPVSTENVVSIITTGKDNPVSIPLIEDSHGKLGVLYFTQKLCLLSFNFSEIFFNSTSCPPLSTLDFTLFRANSADSISKKINWHLKPFS